MLDSKMLMGQQDLALRHAGSKIQARSLDNKLLWFKDSDSSFGFPGGSTETSGLDQTLRQKVKNLKFMHILQNLEVRNPR